MNRYNINSAMVSILSSVRNSVTTKEKVEDHCKGKYREKNSINDDLDSFYERVCLGDLPNEKTRTYFFPKLSEYEAKLFEAKDEEFLQTLADPYDLFGISLEMEIGNGNKIEPEYIKCECSRQTFLICNDEDYQWL